MKERIISIFLLLLAGLTVWAIVAELPKKNYARPASDFTEAVRSGTESNTQSPASAMPAVAGEVIRLHILADSDSERDQAIKLALRDALLPYLNAATLNASSKEEAMQQLNVHCTSLTELANAVLSQMQAGYTATISLERIYFPLRIYGSQTYLSADAVVFPPGFYDSVQVTLGSGEGHNWWCLAYPSLCFIDSTYSYVPKDSNLYKLKIGTVPNTALEKLFYGEAIPDIPENDKFASSPLTQHRTSSDDTTVFVSFKLWELVKSLFQRNEK